MGNLSGVRRAAGLAAVVPELCPGFWISGARRGIQGG
jgi:hypothetical protein